MKRILLFTFIIGLLGCKRDHDTIYNFVDLSDKANIKFVHVVTNAFATPAATVQAGLQVYANNTKVTATNLAFGGVFPSLEFSKIKIGSASLKVVIPAGSLNQEILIKDSTLTDLQKDSTYTVFITDTLPQTSFVVVKENLAPIADSGKCFVRLINLTQKSAGYNLLDTAGGGTIVAPDVKYKTVSAYQQVFVASGGKRFWIRKPSTTTNLLSIDMTPVAGRMYTFFCYGTDGVTTGSRAIKATFMTSRFQTMLY